MVNKNSLLLPLLFIIIPNLTEARTVKNIEIEATGEASNDATSIGEVNACKKFRPNKMQLIKYFDLAEESSELSKINKYYSSCISYGYVEFDDGASGKWIILSSGVGTVTLPSGKSINFFHKNNGWEDPYACTYGLGDKPEC